MLAAAIKNLIFRTVSIEPNFPVVVRKRRENYRIALIARLSAGDVECHHIARDVVAADIGRCVTSDYQ